MVPDSGASQNDDVDEITAGLIWRALGSPYAPRRWRASHCIRALAGLGRWKTVDLVVRKLMTRTAGPFQASELAFYWLHARLWLLISLARVALDQPAKISLYKNELLSFVVGAENQHVLIRHFAAQALLSCVDAGHLDLPSEVIDSVRAADRSPFPRLTEKTRRGGGFYESRPESAPKPAFEFDLDYDFHKGDVDNLSRVFGKQCWEVADMMSAIVHTIDPASTSMYESAGRGSRYHSASRSMTGYHHSYGQQLGWHALFFAAGELLASHPVTRDWMYRDDPWGEWLASYSLTRTDGLWLSDGTDNAPLDAAEVLLETKADHLEITGNPDKVLGAASLKGQRVRDEVVVEGLWHSPDGIEVHISSALVRPDQATRSARRLSRENPMDVWLPVFDGTEEIRQVSNGPRSPFTPWLVCPSGYALLDKHDPHGVPCANTRTYPAPEYAALCGISCSDPFGRLWHNSRGTASVRVQAWGRETEEREGASRSGHRTLCRASALRRILTRLDRDLLILIEFQRYEKQLRGSGQFSHTIGIAHIDQLLDVAFVEGRINYPHRSRY